MARRAALIALAAGLLSCGSNDWTCNWQCTSPENSSGTATYPNGPDPTQQCTADHGVGCTNFTCNCTQQ
jgi:hypothetical protein